MRGHLWFCLHCCGLNVLGRLRHRRLPLVIYYHGVSDAVVAEDPFQPFVTSAQFRRHLEVLAGHYRPVSLADLLRTWRADPAAIDRHVAITFDDGFLNNGSVAWPILKEFGFPGTVFLATGLTGSPYGDRWRDHLACHLLFAREDTLEFVLRGRRRRLALGSLADRQAILDRAEEVIAGSAGTSQDELDEASNAICSSAHPQLPAGAEERYRMMSWDDARRFAREGLTFASHTRGHVYLTRCGDRRLREELEESRKALDDNLGQQPEHRLLGYPYGDADERVQAAARECGYDAAFATAALASPFAGGPIDPYLFPRVGVGRGLGRLEFAAALAGTRERLIALKRRVRGGGPAPGSPARTGADLLAAIGAEPL